MSFERYWGKDTQGEDIEVLNEYDDNGRFITGKLLRIKKEIRSGQEYRTKSYFAERNVNTITPFKQTAIARDINNVKKRRG